MTSDAARNLIRTDPAAAEEMVAQLRADTVIAIEKIRRMVYAYRILTEAPTNVARHSTSPSGGRVSALLPL